MSTERALPPFYAVEQRRKYWPLPYSGLKRKFSSLVLPPGQGQFCYPSPPMSSPPSPPLSAGELSHGAASEPSAIVPASSTSANVTAPTLPIPPPIVQATAPPAPAPPPQHSGTLLDRPALASSLTGPSWSQAPSFGILHTGIVASGAPAFTTGPALAGQSSNRSGAKSKAHVASACINCKRAHLSCDVQRPCARCVASGKQDSCYDVQHKKRGRPRLREEGDFKIEQMVAEQPAGVAVPIESGQSNSRPIAAPRQRRADSLQSLRSQTSERSSLLTPSLPPPSTFQSAFNHPQPPSSVALAPAEVPTAFLDVDLIILRANQPFKQIINEGQDVKDRQLGEIAAPADSESFQTIRNRLRAEREAREPSYMPPIIQSGQDPIQGISEADIERLTYGFTDHTYTWTRSPAGPTAETFPARVRLAKATAYFVVVTLPSFRPAHPKGASAVSVIPFAPPPLSPMSAHPPTTVPGGVYPPMPASFLPPSPRPSSGAQAYPAIHRGTSYQHPSVPSTLPLPAAQPPFETRSFAPPAAVGEVMQPPAIRGQLAPVSGTSIMAAGASSQGKAETPPQQASSSEEGEDRSPKKRRRVGIDEVLQR